MCPDNQKAEADVFLTWREKNNFEFECFSWSLIFKQAFIAIANQINTLVWYVDMI